MEWTREYKMSLTIDYHEYDNSYNATSASNKRYQVMMAEVWKAVAAHFASNEREDIFYELLNEPDMSEGKVTAAQWTEAAQGIIDSSSPQSAVRSLSKASFASSFSNSMVNCGAPFGAVALGIYR